MRTQRQPLTEPQPFLHLSRAAALWPDAPALVTATASLTFLELATQSARIAVALRRRGVAKGDSVAVSIDRASQLVAIYALFALAAVSAIPPGPLGHDDPVAFDWLITTNPEASNPHGKVIVWDDDFLVDAANVTEPLELEPFDSFDSAARIVYSSGTTGRQSAVAFSIDILERRSAIYEDCVIDAVPVMSLLGLGGAISTFIAYSNIANGDPYLAPGSASENLELMSTFVVGTLIASPVQVADVVDAAIDANAQLGDLALILAAGSAVPPRLASRVAKVSSATILPGYGTTEAGVLAGGHPRPDGSLAFSLFGDFGTIDVVDDEGRSCTPGTIGHLRIKTSTQVAGYLGDDEATRRQFRDGWFYPGDRASLEDDGSFILQGRSNEVINAGGVKVDPSAIDAAIGALPFVADVAAFPVTSTSGLDAPALAVVSTSDEPERDVEQLVGSFRNVVHGLDPAAIFFVRAIPRNDMGKVQREVLRQRFANHQATSS